MCPGVGLLDHMVVLFLVFWGTSILLSVVTSPISVPKNSVRGLPFLHTLFVICNIPLLYVDLNFFFFNLFDWVSIVACGIYFPDQGSNPGPLHWERRVPASRPSREIPICRLFQWWPFWPVWSGTSFVVLICVFLIISDVDHLFTSRIGLFKTNKQAFKKSLVSHSVVWLFCDRMNCRPPGSSVHGISQARILEWVAISFCRGSSPPRDSTRASWLNH